MSEPEWQLHEGRIPATEAEHAAVDKLIADNSGVAVSFARRDTGESGPLIVHVGDDSYEVDDAGNSVKQ